jgi:hypothetical protein
MGAKATSYLIQHERVTSSVEAEQISVGRTRDSAQLSSAQFKTTTYLVRARWQLRGEHFRRRASATSIARPARSDTIDECERQDVARSPEPLDDERRVHSRRRQNAKHPAVAYRCSMHARGTHPERGHVMPRAEPHDASRDTGGVDVGGISGRQNDPAGRRDEHRSASHRCVLDDLRRANARTLR